jgi:hypothetical protein
MLTASEIRQLKKKYKKVFTVTIGGEECIFRAITLGEFKEVTANNSGRWQVAEAEDAIVELSLVSPSSLNTDRLPAGVISSLAEQILEASQFDDDIDHLNSVLEDKRAEIESFHTAMMIFIIAAMPRYTIEDLEAKTFGELLSMLAMAEAIFRIQKDIYNPNIAEIKLNVKSEDPEEAMDEYDPDQDPIIQKLMAAMPKAPKPPPMKVPRGTPANEVEIEYE